MIPSLHSRKFILAALLTFCLGCFGIHSNAQESVQKPIPNTRISVSVSDEKTNIWISDFPKNVSVVFFDEEFNMLTIISTNDFGAGFTRLPRAYNTRIFAKTLNGETVAAAVMPDKTEAKVASIEAKNSSKS
jgi:hypothetical protein